MARSGFSEVFLSTPSARRATGHLANLDLSGIISIHALREEGDSAYLSNTPAVFNFYPRPPRGGRRVSWPTSTTHRYFYPRPPRGGRRTDLQYARRSKNFYPRPPRGGRREDLCCWMKSHNFYPRPPRGGRHTQIAQVGFHPLFLFTPSARRATSYRSIKHRPWTHFYPRPPRGGRRKAIPSSAKMRHFYPRPPRGGRPLPALSLADRA